jgi:hypothetical protein
MTVSEAFLIVVDDVISMYSLASPYSCTGIEELLQTYITIYLQAVSAGYMGVRVS